ncbi:acyltransferase family protein [Nonomuraea sp. NBC_01738]|uniref:acyltransferase family protein n=1 Tax=Nonomuraea sp. NBC_01738 TaxID=2976003 RepID=UPI003FA34679
MTWFGVAVVAVMFAGTALRRWEDREGGLLPVAVTAVLVAIAPLWARQNGWWWAQPDVWLTTLGLTALTFAVGMALRHRRVPRFLAWLGLISYSLYLVHHPMLKYLVALTGDLRRASLPLQLAVAAAFTAAILAASWLTYRSIEQPAQRAGARLRAALQ